MSKRHRNLLRKALRLAEKSTNPWRLGCILAHGKRIISRGVNDSKGHPRAYRDSGRHAELDAVLRSAPEELDGAFAYVGRITKTGRPAMAKPCWHCEELLRDSGISRVYYSIGPGEWGVLEI